MRKLLDSVFLIFRQPVIHRNDSGIIWCLSPSISDYKVRKLNLETETELYKLLVSETGSPVMHNAWFSTLMANAMYARFAARGCSFCYLNKPDDSDLYVKASLRQVSRVGPGVRISFEWGNPMVHCVGDIGTDIGRNTAKILGTKMTGKNGRHNEIIIHARPSITHASISALCDYVFLSFSL